MDLLDGSGSLKLLEAKLRPDGKPGSDSHVDASGPAESSDDTVAAEELVDLKPSPVEPAAPAAVIEPERGVKRAATLTLDMGEEGAWRGCKLVKWLGGVPFHADVDVGAAACASRT